MTEPEAATVRVEAPAKVNLYLRIVGRRNDGYHLLDSLVVFPAVGDTIEVQDHVIARRRSRRAYQGEAGSAGWIMKIHSAEYAFGYSALRRHEESQSGTGLSLTVTGPFAHAVPDGDDNLVLRAARLLAEAAGRPACARIRLVKRLPVASGIGGGSADAAAALVALARLWRLDAAVVDLPALARRLGADVPMCLSGRAVFAGGIGEEIVPAPPLPRFSLLLANPGVPVATQAVFAARRGGFSAPWRFSEPPADAEALTRLLAEAGNDLSEAAEGMVPEIAEVLAALRAQPGALLCRMSGSGATCFALFAHQAEAEAARAAFAARHPSWWLAAAPVLPALAAQGKTTPSAMLPGRHLRG